MPFVRTNPPDSWLRGGEASTAVDRSFRWADANGDPVPGRFGVRLLRPAPGPWALERDPAHDEIVAGRVVRAAYVGIPGGGPNLHPGCAEVPATAMGTNAAGLPVARIRFNGLALDITTQEPPDNCG